MKNEDRINLLTTRINLQLIIIMVVFIASVAFSMALNNKISDLEASAINADEWVEGCGEWETVEKHELINPNIAGGCDRFCKIDILEPNILYDCVISSNKKDNYTEKYCYKADERALCVGCYTSTEPYIYTWTKEVCAQEILVKK